MKRLKFLLLDANIVIKLFELGLWDQIIERCDIFLSQTIVEHEARYYEAGEIQVRINLLPYIENNKLTVIDIHSSELQDFVNKFDPSYFERLDPGESEALAYLCRRNEPFRLCSSDSIVFKVLPQLDRVEQGISLEEVLQQLGLWRQLEWEYTKAFKERWTKIGQQDKVRGIGLK